MRKHPLHLPELGRRSHDHVFHNLAAAWINLFSTRTRTLELNRRDFMRSAILHPAASHSVPHLRRVAAAPPRSHRLATPPRQRRSARAGAAILEGTAMGRHGRSRGRGHSQRAPEPLVDTPHSTTPGSAPRKWVAPPDTTPDAHGVRLRVMSYNILSEDIRRSTSFLYRDVRDPACCWPHRRQLISREVAHYGADVVSMQEVEERSGIIQDMDSLGYAAVFLGRTGGKPDGCAVFWKRSRLSCVARSDLRMVDLGLNDNAAQVVALRPCGDEGAAAPPPPDIVLGNIHVLFNNKRGDTKLGQVRTLIETVHATMAPEARPPLERGGAAPPAVGLLMGDFNSAPDSAMYRFLVDGELDVTAHDVKDVSGQRSAQPPGRGRRASSSSLASAPRPVDPLLAPPRAARCSHQAHSSGGGGVVGDGFLRPRSGGGWGGRGAVAAGSGAGRRGGSGHWRPEGQSRHRPGPVGEGLERQGAFEWSREARAQAFGSQPSAGAAPVLRHGLHLESTYATCLGGEPQYTTANVATTEAVDFMLFTPSGYAGGGGGGCAWRVRPLAALDVPPASAVAGGCPHRYVASDHVCLVADFELAPADDGGEA